MNIKIENAKYLNERGTVSGKRGDYLSFNADVTDLDNELFKGTLPYTFVDFNVENVDISEISEIRKYIKSKLNEIEVENYKSYEDNIVLTLYNYKIVFCEDIDEDCNLFIKSYDSIYYDNDLFDYSLDSQNILSNFINNYNNLISDNKIEKENIQQDFISASNTTHKLSYNQMVELFNLMVSRYSTIKLHARALKDKINNSTDIDEIKNVEWDLWVL